MKYKVDMQVQTVAIGCPISRLNRSKPATSATRAPNAASKSHPKLTTCRISTVHSYQWSSSSSIAAYGVVVDVMGGG